MTASRSIEVRQVGGQRRLHDVHFANFDNRLSLVIDGHPVFGDGAGLCKGDTRPVLPTAGGPGRRVAVRAEGTSVVVSDLVLKRDILLYPQSRTSRLR